MVLVTSAPILLAVLLLVAVIGMHVAPTLARWAAGIRLPVFPSASGRWIFEARPDLPADHAVASGQVATFAGPESVREVTVATDRAHAYLTGLLVATTGLAVVCSVGLCDPHAPRRWLPPLVLLNGANGRCTRPTRGTGPTSSPWRRWPSPAARRRPGRANDPSPPERNQGVYQVADRSPQAAARSAVIGQETEPQGRPTPRTPDAATRGPASNRNRWPANRRPQGRAALATRKGAICCEPVR